MTEVATQAVNSTFKSTKPAILNFPQLTEAKKFKDPVTGVVADKAYFTTQAVFSKDHPDIARIKAAAVAVAKEKWPGRDIAADYKSGAIGMPWELGDAKIAELTAKATAKNKKAPETGHLVGALILKAKTGEDKPPILTLIEGGAATILDSGTLVAQNKNKFYSGVDALLVLNFRAGTFAKRDYVTAYIRQVTSLNTGKKLVGGEVETFSDYVGKETTENPLNDEIPF